MSKNIGHIQHVKSNVVENGSPKLPQPSVLVEGELAINYATGFETISIKNASGDIVSFSSDEIILSKVNEVEIGETQPSSGSPVEIWIDTTENPDVLNVYTKSETDTLLLNKLDITAFESKLGSGFTGENSANTVTSVIAENEETWALALNQLNNDKVGYAEYDSENQVINFYKDSESSTGTPISSIDTSDFGGGGESFWVSGTGQNAIVQKGTSGVASGDYAVAEGYQTSGTGLYSHAEGSRTIAIGDSSHAEGTGRAIGDNSHAEGYGMANGSTSHAEGTGQAIGIYSHAEGHGTATGDTSHAEGTSRAFAQYSHAEGQNTIASGNSSHAEGYTTSAMTYYSHAEGSRTIAIGDSSHAEGQNTIASGYSSHAEGNYTQASGSSSHAEGAGTRAFGSSSHAEGQNTIASGYSSHAEGYYAQAIGDYSHAEGQNTIASGYSSHSEGYQTSAMTYYSHAEGQYTIASGQSSHAEGNSTKTIGEYSHAEGYATSAITSYSHAEGWGTKADGQDSHAEGQYTIASGKDSHAEGNYTQASGSSSHAEGAGTRAFGISSHAEGGYTSAMTYYSHAEGSSTVASGSSSHAEGNVTKAIGGYSHAEGSSTQASGTSSHAEGYETIASGENSHAEGDWTKAIGESSHAEGNGTSATNLASHAEGRISEANGAASHAEGAGTQANGIMSHAEGGLTIANNNSEHASGLLNISSSASTTFGNSGNTLFSVGNGDDTIGAYVRHNAFEIRQNGDIYIADVDDTTSPNYYEKPMVRLQDLLTGATITVDQVMNSGTSASTNAVSTKAVYDYVTENELVVSGALNDLEERKLDASAYTPTDLSNYYTKSETSGATEISNALGAKVNSATFTAHTADTTIHLTSGDVKTQIDDRLGSGFTGANSANTVTSVIESNERVISSSLNDLEERKLDASAYTPTDLSNYYTKSETSGASQISTALNDKASNTAFTAHTADTTSHLTSTEKGQLHTHSNKTYLDGITGSVGTMAYENASSYSSATQVNTALSGKSDTGHTHDDRYYTEAEIDILVGSGFTSSSITDVIIENEQIVSSSLNDLYNKKLDASAYTPSDFVSTATTVSGGTGLSGGGNLGSDVILNLAMPTVHTATTYTSSTITSSEPIVYCVVTASGGLNNQTCPVTLAEGQQCIVIYKTAAARTISFGTTGIITPDGSAISITTKANGYCEVNYIKLNGDIFLRGV